MNKFLLKYLKRILLGTTNNQKHNYNDMSKIYL